MEFNLLFLGQHESETHDRFYTINKHTSSVGLLTDRKQNYILFDTGSVSFQEVLLEKLDNLGVKPEQINHILITHSHLDHCGNLALFKNAKVHISACYMDSQTAETVLYKDMHEKPIPLGVEVFPSRGHTFDHVSYFFEVDGQRYCFAGDAIRENHFTEGVPDYISLERRLMYLDSARHLFESSDVLIPGHFNIIDGEQKDFLYLKLLEQEEKILKRLSIFDKVKHRKLLNEIRLKRKFLKD